MNRKSKKRKTDKVKPKLELLIETKRSIFAILLFAFAFIIILAFFNIAGSVGQGLTQVLQFIFGWGRFLIPFLLIFMGIKGIRCVKGTYPSTALGMGLFIVSFLGILGLLGADGFQSQAFLGGGYLGMIISYPLAKLFGFWASLVILSSLLIISLLVSLDLTLTKLLRLHQKSSQVDVQDFASGMEAGGRSKTLDLSSAIKTLKSKLIPSEFKVKDIDGQGSKNGLKLPDLEVPSEKTLNIPHKPFPLELLGDFEKKPFSGDIKKNSNIIKQTLQNFGIEVEMGKITVGPTVTQYTLRPAAGIKLSYITSLQNDLALALAAHPLRIEAPIPGKHLVGIEIPNIKKSLVALKSLLEDPSFKNCPSLSIILGRDVSGEVISADLAKMPHLLVAGATGSGKTVCLNTILATLIYRNSPQVLKFILIDPKRVEFTAYNGIEYLLTPVVVDAEQAINALEWAVKEMEERFKILQKAGRRDISSYNTHNCDNPLPYIVLAVDELADLMASHGRQVEAAIVRLAQMARAVGIHLIISTQRPSVEVITGLIKANITARVAFQVASQIDSRTILDMAGAEKLLGNGDMLYLASDSRKPRRIQAAFITEKEIKDVTSFLKSEQKPDYDEELTKEIQEKSTLAGGVDLIEDELYDDAKEVIIQAGKASASLLQRRMRIGYARAARILDLLEERGVIGPADGAKPRKILNKEEQSEL